jgi:hypothetical protein
VEGFDIFSTLLQPLLNIYYIHRCLLQLLLWLRRRLLLLLLLLLGE